MFYPDVGDTEESRDSLLHWAASQGLEELADTLLTLGETRVAIRIDFHPDTNLDTDIRRKKNP
jgi:hypothetical protein